MNEFEKKRSDYIRRLGNPYAAEQIEFSFAAPETPIGIYARHPYAFASALLDSESEVAGEAVATKLATAEFVSKADFQRECRRIFVQYRPALDQRSLPSQYRNFITRNEGRSGAHRRRILNSLQKYDLSQTIGLRAQFNREDSVITENKLQKIEDDSLMHEQRQ